MLAVLKTHQVSLNSKQAIELTFFEDSGSGRSELSNCMDELFEELSNSSLSSEGKDGASSIESEDILSSEVSTIGLSEPSTRKEMVRGPTLRFLAPFVDFEGWEEVGRDLDTSIVGPFLPTIL